jgi:DNA-binding CsgD family transcriptional regulator
MHRSDSRSDVSFSPRQREVARLIAAGCTDAEIGGQLGISARTVRAHSDVLREKLAVHRRRLIPAAYARFTGENVFGAQDG